MCVEDQIGCHHVVAVTGSEMGDMSLFYYRDGVDVLVSKTSVPAILNGNTSLRLPAQTTGCKADVSHPTCVFYCFIFRVTFCFLFSVTGFLCWIFLWSVHCHVY
eukprot:m.186866 g.186866  ORF g.186866 m.186866 type:complete len:104 (+) comp39355_c0_seq20:1325-1636(+)